MTPAGLRAAAASSRAPQGPGGAGKGRLPQTGPAAVPGGWLQYPQLALQRPGRGWPELPWTVRTGTQSQRRGSGGDEDLSILLWNVLAIVSPEERPRLSMFASPSRRCLLLAPQAPVQGQRHRTREHAHEHLLCREAISWDWGGLPPSGPALSCSLEPPETLPLRCHRRAPATAHSPGPPGRQELWWVAFRGQPPCAESTSFLPVGSGHPVQLLAWWVPACRWFPLGSLGPSQVIPVPWTQLPARWQRPSLTQVSK